MKVRVPIQRAISTARDSRFWKSPPQLDEVCKRAIDFLLPSPLAVTSKKKVLYGALCGNVSPDRAQSRLNFRIPMRRLR